MNKRKKVCEVALDLFIKNGYENTTTNILIKKCGISKSSLYYRFESKEEIMDAAIVELFSKDLESINMILNSQRISNIKKLEKVFDMAIKTGRNKNFGEKNSTFYIKVTEKIKSTLERIIKELIRECVYAKEIEDLDHEVAAAFIYSAIVTLFEKVCCGPKDLKYIKEFFEITSIILGAKFKFNEMLKKV